VVISDSFSRLLDYYNFPVADFGIIQAASAITPVANESHNAPQSHECFGLPVIQEIDCC
jgi:hypothetical protein